MTPHRHLPAIAMMVTFSLAGLLGSPSASAQALQCATSPFGQRVVLGVDRDLAVAGVVIASGNQRVATGETMAGPNEVSFVGVPLSSAFANVRDLQNLALDLNGDGEDEIVYVGRSAQDFPVVAVFDQSGNLIDEWTAQQRTIQDIQAAAIDARGRRDGTQDLALVVRSADRVNAYVLFGAANGGIAASDGSVNARYTRTISQPDQVALATGDFLPGQPSGLAMVTWEQFGGQGRLHVDLVRYSPGVPTNGDRLNTLVTSFSHDIDAVGDAFDLKATAGRFEPGSGAQLAVAIQQFEESTVAYPVRLEVFGFTPGDPTPGSRRLFSEIALQGIGGSAFDIGATDLSRDGLDQLILGFINRDGQESVALRVLGRNRLAQATLATGFVELGEVAYPLSSIATPNGTPSAQAIRALSLYAGQLDQDGYGDVATAIAFNGGRDVRRWQLSASPASEVGLGCAGNAVIGSAECPGDRFVPFPNPGGVPIAGKGQDFGRFRGQRAEGTWRLCVADSVSSDLGQLARFSLRLNGTSYSASAVPPMAIPDNSPALDTCLAVDVPDGQGPVASIEVEASIAHTFVGDLTLELISPVGAALTLMNRPASQVDLSPAQPIRFVEVGAINGVTTPFDTEPYTSNDWREISISAGDFTGSSTVALLDDQSVCRRVVEKAASTVIFTPPIFKGIQDASSSEAFVGRAVQQGTRQGTSFESFNSHSFSGYLGASIGGSAPGVELAASSRLTFGSTLESTRGVSESFESSLSVADSQALDDGRREGLVVGEESAHDCYNYSVFQGSSRLPDNFVRLCEHKQSTLFADNVQDWNHQSDPGLSWAALTRDWQNLALEATVSASGGSPSRAVDGRIQDALGTAIPLEQNSYLILDLGTVRNISSIRIFLDPANAADFNPLKVYVYKNEIDPGSVFRDVGVPVFDPVARAGGGVTSVVAFPTTSVEFDTVTPIRGRYVRLSPRFGGDPARIDVREVQVFGAVENAPEVAPIAVCDETMDDGWFKVKRYIRRLGRAEWIDSQGDLDWSPEDAATGCADGLVSSPQVVRLGVLRNIGLNGSGTQSWEITNTLSNSLQASQSNTRSNRVGAELDVTVGSGIGPITAAIQAGGGYEFAGGVTSAESSETFWTRELNVGGSIPGIPSSAGDGRNTACNYGPRPFSYRTSFIGLTGFEHRVKAVDYLVVTPAWTRGNLPVVCGSAPRIAVSRDGEDIPDGFPSNGEGLPNWLGNINVGETATVEFVVHNDGSAPLDLDLNGLNVSSPGDSVFRLESAPPRSRLESGQSTFFEVSFTPSGPFFYEGAVTLRSDDEDQPIFDFLIGGRGEGALRPNLKVLRGADEIRNRDTTPATSDGTDFGFVDAGQTVTRTFTLRESNGAPLELTADVAVTGEGFSISRQPARSLAGGASTTFDVSYLSPEGISSQGTVTIRSTDPNDDPFAFDLRALGPNGNGGGGPGPRGELIFVSGFE